MAKSNRNPDLAQDLGKNQVRMNLMKRAGELGVKLGPGRSMKTQGGTLFHITFILNVPRPPAPAAATTEAPLNL